MLTYADICRALGDLAVFVLMLLVVLLGFQQACLSRRTHTHAHASLLLTLLLRMLCFTTTILVGSAPRVPAGMSFTWSFAYAYASRRLAAAPHRIRTYAHVCSRMQAFTLQFGSQTRDYSTLSMALISLFRTLLGDFRYEDLQASQLSSGLAGTKIQILSQLLVKTYKY